MILRRLAASVLTLICPPVGLLFAGWPTLAAVVGVGLPFVGPALMGSYAAGILPVSAIVPGLGLLLAVLVVVLPLLALVLPPRPGHRLQLPIVYVALVPLYYGLTGGAGFGSRRIVAPYNIPAASMAPALMPGDFILVDKRAEVAPGDVIVFRHPTQPDTDYVKRVIATAGQTVEVRDGVVLLDGVALPRVDWDTVPETLDSRCQPAGARREWQESLGGHTYVTRERTYDGLRMMDYGPKEVPPGHLFVLGDNRDDSADSRVWGFVPVENVEGVVTDRHLSLDPCDGMWRGDRVGPVP